MKRLGKRLLAACGLQARRIQRPGSHLRPIGDLVSFLEDIRARGFNPPLIFDVGASDGAWSKMVAPVFPDARILLVEPRPSMRAALDALCASHRHWIMATCAVGVADGTGVLTDWSTASTIVPVATTSAPQIPVLVETLDTLASRVGVPALVKLDIEGAELDALRGGAGRLLGATDIFIVEVALYEFEGRPLLNDIIMFMRDHDYFVSDIAGVIRRPLDGAVGLMDLCFARRTAAFRGHPTAW